MGGVILLCIHIVYPAVTNTRYIHEAMEPGRTFGKPYTQTNIILMIQIFLF